MMDKTIFKPNDKVKISVDVFTWQRGTLTDKFLNFIDSNVDTVFTLKEYKLNSKLWMFEEDPLWLFYEDNLIKVDD